MHTKITLKNYRCFSDEHPATFELRPGFTSLIGINNAGKSTLLRFLHEFRNLFAELAKQNLHNTLNARQSGNTYQLSNLFPDPMFDASIIYHDHSTAPLRIDLELIDPINLPETTYHLTLQTERLPTPLFTAELRRNHILIDRPNLIDETDWPLLTAWITSLANTLYISPYRDIGKPFVDQWKTWQSAGPRANNVAIDRLTRQIEHLFGFDRLVINTLPDNSSLQLLIDGQSYLLRDVGAGLAQTIYILANAAIEEPDYILIDEPEIHLHPALQRTFLTTLGDYANHGTLFATHTIGLARSISDRIYSLHRPDPTHTTIHPYETHPNLDQILGELSYASLQENGYDTILLVEGPTEIRVFLHLLRLYKKEHRIVPISLAGNDLINTKSALELSEITRLSTNIVAIIDSERTAEGQRLAKNRQAFEKTCRKLKIRPHILERRAIENYFPATAIQTALNDPTLQALTPYEPLNNRWPKRNNYRIAWEMTKPDLDPTDLGQFLATL